MARRHTLTKKAGWWKFEDQANVKESRQKKQTPLGFSTSQICPEPLFWVQRIPGPGPNPKSYHIPFVHYTEFPLPQRKCLGTTSCALQVWHLTLPPICWAHWASTGARRSPSVPAKLLSSQDPTASFAAAQTIAWQAENGIKSHMDTKQRSIGAFGARHGGTQRRAGLSPYLQGQHLWGLLH